jgi:hypothetical protein
MNPRSLEGHVARIEAKARSLERQRQQAIRRATARFLARHLTEHDRRLLYPEMIEQLDTDLGHAVQTLTSVDANNRPIAQRGPYDLAALIITTTPDDNAATQAWRLLHETSQLRPGAHDRARRNEYWEWAVANFMLVHLERREPALRHQYANHAGASTGDQTA